MSTKELSYVESSSETELLADSNSSQPDDEIGIKEWCQIRCKPSFQIRKVKNKGATLIIIWSYLISSIFTIGKHYIAKHYDNHTLVYVLVLIPMGLTIVLAATLADFRFGRYKIISFSLWIVWICSILLTLTAIITDFTHIGLTQVPPAMLLVLLGIGWGGYQANIIQFGIDQLIDASATECKSFIIWLCWSYFASQVAVQYVRQCFDHNIYLFLIMSCNVTIALVLKLIFSHHLIKEPSTQNPFKLIYKVIKYAIKHKHPRQRSAFTYCEDTIPSRIDFGKSKYGGPFTTEQVEDVKTLLRTITLILLGSVVVCSRMEPDSTFALFINDMSTSHLPVHKCSYDFTTAYFGSILITVLVPLYELVIHPIFHQLIPNVKILYKACIGTLLYLSRNVLLLTLVTYARHSFIDSETSGNSTLQCLFHKPPGFLQTRLDNRWYILSGFLCSIGDVMYLISSLEYLCAQVPYSMKGIVAGSFFACVGLFLPIFSSVHFVFKSTDFTWGTGLISCGFWYFVTIICSLLATIIIFIIYTLKCYKKRKREDVLPSEHIFAERYYSS